MRIDINEFDVIWCFVELQLNVDEFQLEYHYIVVVIIRDCPHGCVNVRYCGRLRIAFDFFILDFEVKLGKA